MNVFHYTMVNETSYDLPNSINGGLFVITFSSNGSTNIKTLLYSGIFSETISDRNYTVTLSRSSAGGPIKVLKPDNNFGIAFIWMPTLLT